MMPSQDDQLYAKWNSWIDVLDTEMVHLFTQRHIFHEVQGLIRSNPLIQSPGDFNDWMAVWYSSSLSIAMRRQADNNKDSISYRRLLESIKTNPRVISRTRFKENFVDWNYTERDADEGFDQLVGPGLEYLDPTRIDSEISELIDRTNPLTHYVNKRVAHRDRKEFTAIPTFRDLNAVIDYLGNLHKRYYTIFRCLTVHDLLPTWHYDWKEVFQYPWINPRRPNLGSETF
jgi:hypothetical protein